MYLEIISPEKKVYEGEINLLKVPGSKGAFEILENHAPIISILSKGTIKVIDKSNKEHTFEIDGGVIEDKDNKIIVLVESV